MIVIEHTDELDFWANWLLAGGGDTSRFVTTFVTTSRG